MNRTPILLKNKASTRKSAAFTLIELLVVIAVIAILAAILFPVFAQAREKARQAACLSNTKQLGLAVYQYVQDYDEVLPMGAWGTTVNGVSVGSRWYRDIYPYVKNIGVYVCPSKADDTGYYRPTLINYAVTDTQTLQGPLTGGAYGINYNIAAYGPIPSGASPSKTLAELADIAGTFLIAEGGGLSADAVGNYDMSTWYKYEIRNTDWQITPPTDAQGKDTGRYVSTNSNSLRRPIARHNGGINVIYCDGHSKWSKAEQFMGPLSATQFGWPYGDPRNSWDDK